MVLPVLSPTQAGLMMKDDDVLPAHVANAAEKNKRKDIQGLRGIAIIYVLIFHLNPNLLPRGFLGVDVFFVISGFLITMILSRHAPLTAHDALQFFSKRVRRIFPAYYITILLVLIVARFYLIGEDYRILTAESKWALSFATNIHKYIQDSDYFAEIGNFDFLLHAWSLAVEIQFYIFAPLLARCMQCGKFGNLALLAILASSLSFNCTSFGPIHFSSLPSRLWQFICGGITYTFPIKNGSKAIVVFSVFLVSPFILFVPVSETLSRIIVTTGAALVVALNDKHLNDYVLGNSLLYFVGEVSYSLYLTHWPVITLMKYNYNVDVLRWKDAILAAEISFVISVVSYKTVEKYFIRKAFWASAVLVSVAGVSSLALMFGANSAFGAKREIVTSAFETSTLNTIKETVTRFQSSCYEFHQVPYLPSNLTEDIRIKAIMENKKLFDYKMKKYTVLYNKTDPLVEKHFTHTNTHIQFPDFVKGNGSLTGAVFGNSYAWMAFPAVVEAFGSRVKELRLLSEAHCMSFEKTAAKANPKYTKYCDPWFEKSMLVIEETKPDIVILINRFSFSMLDKINDLPSDPTLQRMQHTIDRLSNSTRRIILQFPLPTTNTLYTSMILKLLEKNSSLENLFIPYGDFWNSIRYAHERLENLRCPKCAKIYPHKIFCDTKICRVFDPDNLYSFFDSNTHYNAYAGKCLGRLYKDAIEELLAKGYLG